MPAGREERPAEELAWRRICKRRNLLLRMKSGGELNKGRRVIDRLYPIIERAQSVCARSQMAAGKIQGGCQPVSPGTAESSLKKSNQTLSFGPSRIPGLSLGIYGEQFARLMACQGFWGPLFPCGVAQSGEGGAAGPQSEQCPQPRSQCDGHRGITRQRVLAWCQHGLDPGAHPAWSSHPGLNTEAPELRPPLCLCHHHPSKGEPAFGRANPPCVGP